MRSVLGLVVLGSWLVMAACRSAAGGEGVVPVGRWTVVELEGAELGETGRAPEITIGEDGALSGFAGVNRFSGRAEPEALRAGGLVVGPLAATRMAGPPAAMAVEARLLETLTMALAWRRAGEELTLEAGGRIVVRLREAH